MIFSARNAGLLHIYKLCLGNKPIIEKSTGKGIMKIGMGTLVVLSLSIQLLSASSIKSQPVDKVEVTIGLKNESLVQLLNKIKSQTSFYFVYRNEDVDNLKNLNIPLGKRTVAALLEKFLYQNGLSYRQIDNQILISPGNVKKRQIIRPPLNKVELPARVLKIIKGRVTNAEGEPMEGVNIMIKGSSNGTSSDREGMYTINASEGDILVFSYVGFETKEVIIGEQTLINITMTVPSEKSLGEIVVTALGIKRNDKTLAYSTQTIGGNKINVAKDAINPINSLKGQVAGLTISNVGDGISSSPKVLLRGSRSITGNNAPLYVTDGVPGGMGLLDPNNIESITVLKGASAAAAYGSAGQNGAIIITTKKARSGKFTVNYNGGMTFDQALILTKFQYEYGQGEGGVYYPNSESSWGPKATGQIVELWNGHSVPLKGQTNRFKDFYQTGKTINNSVNISGGSDKMQTSLSYSNTRVIGILRKNNWLTRHTLDLKIQNNITSKLSINANLSYAFDDQSVSSQYPYSSIYVIPMSIPLNEMQDYRYTDNNGKTVQNYWKPNTLGSNPYFSMNGDISTSVLDRLMGVFTAKYKFSSWLDLQVRASLSRSTSKSEQKKYAGISPVQNVWGNDYFLNTSASRGTYMDALLTYSRALSKNFNLSGNIGASISDGRTEGINSHTNGLFKEDLFYLENGKVTITKNSFRRSPEVQGVYGLGTLSFKNSLFLELTGRNDWSSALPKGQQSYFYPSVGLTAVLSEIAQLPSWVSFGKVRVSYAQSGYGGIEYLTKNYYSVGPEGAIATPTIQILNNYKPELTGSYEAGLDWRFFNSRFGFNLTYYHTETKNQLLLIGAPSASLYDQRYINAGLIRNSGVELTVNLNPVKTDDFSWDMTFNYAKNKNKVVKLTDEVKSVVISGYFGSAGTVKAVEGSSYGDIFVKGWQRDSLGRKLVNDQGIPLLTAGQDVYAGNYNPNFMMGLSNSFSYRNFSLSFLIDYRNGGQVISSSQALLDGRGNTEATLKGRNKDLILDAYTVEGEKNTKAISAQSYYSSIGDIYLAGEFYNYSATNMRLRELTISYKVPPRKKKKGLLTNAEIALVGRNLFYFKRLAPFDAEINSFGGNSGGQEFGYIPSTRNLGFNIKLSF